MKLILETDRSKFEALLAALPPMLNYRLVAYAGHTEHGVYTGSALRWEDADTGVGYTVGSMAPDGNFGSVVATLSNGWVNKVYLGKLVEGLA